MSLTIRRADVRDACDITRVYVESWNEGFAGLAPARRPTEELLARWEHDLALPLPHRWWLAEVDGRVAGFAGIGPSRDPIDPQLGELDTIAVEPASWRRGIGRGLMDVSVQHLAGDGYTAAVLWTFARYQRGLAFYRAMGWNADGGTRDAGRQLRLRRALR